jgi:glyoxylase-like metal-dependent hydrolase (beta-lactamase superfamily II)
MISTLQCGAFTLMAIEDGWFHRFPHETFPTSDPAYWEAHPEHLDAGRLRISMGCFLVTDGDVTLLVDTGYGEDEAALPPGSGANRLPEALRSLEVDPGSVSHILYTHLHYDHCGGSRGGDGASRFPNARHYLQRGELDHWMTAEGTAPERVRKVMNGFLEEGRVEVVDGEREVVPGVRVIPTPGHTPGHQAVTITSEGTRTLIAGDVTHHPAQAEHPEWNVAADLDQDLAAATRGRVFEMVAGNGTVLGAGHYPRPGLGRIEIDDGRRIFVPVNPLG